jgi:WD40 repeat protein
VAFSLDGHRIISAGGDKLIKVWDPEIGKETLTLRNHEDSVSAIALDPKGRRLASASRDKTIRLWDATTSP